MFKKERVKGFLSGVILTMVLVLSMNLVFASVANKSISVAFKNIKIFIDDSQITPKDANGNVVEPFIYNGTTYLPIRAVGNAFNKAVVWDGKTNSIYLGQHESSDIKIYLADMNQLFKTTYVDKWQGNDNLGDTYTKGISFYNGYFGETQYVEYVLNGEYKKLKGKFVLTEGSKNETGTSVLNIYGDDKLIYSSENMTGGVLPIDVDVDVVGILKLKIEVVHTQAKNAYVGAMTVGFVDSRLY